MVHFPRWCHSSFGATPSFDPTMLSKGASVFPCLDRKKQGNSSSKNWMNPLLSSRAPSYKILIAEPIVWLPLGSGWQMPQ